MATILAQQRTRSKKLTLTNSEWTRPTEVASNLDTFNGSLKVALEELFKKLSIGPEPEGFLLWKKINDYNSSAKIYNATLGSPDDSLASMIAVDGEDEFQYVTGFPETIRHIDYMTTDQVTYVLLKLGVLKNFIVGGGELPDDFEPTAVQKPSQVSGVNGAINGTESTSIGSQAKDDKTTIWLKQQLRVAMGLPAHSTLATVGFP